MFAKAILVFSAQIFLAQSIFSQCIPGGPYIDDYTFSSFGLGAGPVGYGPYDGLGCPGVIAPTTGGGFIVTSFSPISPTGVNVFSENAIDGMISVIGELPFLAAVALDGALPTVGAGGINYGCGNGNVAIISEGLAAPAGPAYPAGLGYGPGLAGPGLGYGPGLAGPSIGYGPGVAGYGYSGLGYGAIY